MTTKVFFSVTMSLDGFMAPEAVPYEDVVSPEKRGDPSVRRWMSKWSELQAWAFPQRFFRENLKLGAGGEEGIDNDVARETFDRTGASVMGKRLFDAGELAWPEEAPFHTPVFVVTHTKRDSWERARPGPRGRRRPRRAYRRRCRNHPGVLGHRPDRRVLGHARARVVRLRDPPFRPCGRRSPDPEADRCRRFNAGDPPDLHRRQAVGSSLARGVSSRRRNAAGAPWHSTEQAVRIDDACDAMLRVSPDAEAKSDTAVRQMLRSPL
jgi:hypothetical protein